MRVVPQPNGTIMLGRTLFECTHPDWHLSYLPGAGEPIDGPYGARRLQPICVECGEPVEIGAPFSDPVTPGGVR